MRRVLVLSTSYSISHDLESVLDTIEIFRREESCFFQMIEQSLTCVRFLDGVRYLAHLDGRGHRVTVYLVNMWHICIVAVPTYTAGASLLRPIVKKNSEIN